MPRLLSDLEISTSLRKMKGWKHEGRFITKSFEFETFMDAMSFVNTVAAVAEKEEHHPDIHVRYTTVTLSVQTHSERGVTEWDLGLARAIEKNAYGSTRRR